MTETMHKTDHELKTAIMDELEWTPHVNADRIGVAVTDRGITLSGEVRSYPEKEAAVRAAQRVSGVIAVADEILVRHGTNESNDADIARNASDALERSVIIPAGSIKARVHDHRITLTGQVPWHYQREAAVRAVDQLPGVRLVDNQIGLHPTILLDPDDAKDQITAALARSAQLSTEPIRVAVRGSKVSLTGTVGSWAERRQAEHAAWSTPGVTEVHNHLTIRS